LKVRNIADFHIIFFKKNKSWFPCKIFNQFSRLLVWLHLNHSTIYGINCGAVAVQQGILCNSNVLFCRRFRYFIFKSNFFSSSMLGGFTRAANVSVWNLLLIHQIRHTSISKITFFTFFPKCVLLPF
jgi:hypothetical protein